MKTLTVGNLKSEFSTVVKEIRSGKKYAVSYGKSKEKVAVIMSFDEYSVKDRKLGLLSKRGKVKFSEDFKITDVDFLNS